MPSLWWLSAILVGAAGGFIGGLLGVGGGILMVPLLMLLLKLPVHDAKATSLAIIVVISIGGTIEHQRLGRLDHQWAIIVIAGLTGALLSAMGARLSEQIPRDLLLKLFACLLIVTGVKYLLPKKAAAAAPAEPALTEPVP